MKRLTVTFIIVLVFSCEAPHDNPLDPKNPDYSYGQISGVVRTVSLPVEPIAQTNVLWLPATEQTLTDAQGVFELLLYQPVNGWLRLSHPDFFPDSAYINWGDLRNIKIEAYLNSLPELDSLAVFSTVLNRFPSLQRDSLVIESYISDRDNDIDSVQAFFYDHNNGFFLPYNPTKKSFHREFSILDLGVFSLEDYVGQPVQISVTDFNNHFLLVGQDQLVRVIYDEVVYVSPTDNQITGPTPNLIWQRFEPGFDFYYDLEIYTNELAPQLVWSIRELPMDQTEITIDSELTEGAYFWVIWAIDSFGNRTRSKPSGFIVQTGA